MKRWSLIVSKKGLALNKVRKLLVKEAVYKVKIINLLVKEANTKFSP